MLATLTILKGWQKWYETFGRGEIGLLRETKLGMGDKSIIELLKNRHPYRARVTVVSTIQVVGRRNVVLCWFCRCVRLGEYGNCGLLKGSLVPRHSPHSSLLCSHIT